MQQLTLFNLDKQPPVEYIPNFLTAPEADELYNHCRNLNWQQNNIKIIGKTMPVPRLECMYGDAGCSYLYSKSVLLEPIPWTTELLELRSLIQSTTNYRFNIALCNRYRSGRDSVGWHNDNEPSMGTSPAIASLTLGSTRKFQLKSNSGGKPINYWLEHGSLLLMQPGCQESWIHQLPKTSKPVKERINLTFRPHVNGIYSKLETYSNQTGANLATTATYLIQNKLEELEEKGLLEIKADKALEQLLEAMLDGIEEQDVDFEKIAKALKRDAKDLKRIYEKITSCEECKK